MTSVTVSRPYAVLHAHWKKLKMLSTTTAVFSFWNSVFVDVLFRFSFAVSEVQSDNATASMDPIASKSSFIVIFKNSFQAISWKLPAAPLAPLSSTTNRWSQSSSKDFHSSYFCKSYLLQIYKHFYNSKVGQETSKTPCQFFVILLFICTFKTLF